tara:strand:+ start:778 stop:975 length:198 start_codon:yes stop_codon:yes gene_type:complete
MRCLDFAVRIGRRDIPDTQIIGEDKNDIRFFRALDAGGSETKEEAEAEESFDHDNEIKGYLLMLE